MGLYISDDYGLGNFELALVALATETIRLQQERIEQCSKLFSKRRERTRSRSNEARWTLPPK